MPKRILSPRSPYALALLLLVAALFSGPAAPDLVSGSKAYASRDFDRAFKDFQDLAKLGQPTAPRRPVKRMPK